MPLLELLAVATLGLAAANDSDDSDDDGDLLDLLGEGLTVSFTSKVQVQRRKTWPWTGVVPPDDAYPRGTFMVRIYEGNKVIGESTKGITVAVAVASAVYSAHGADGGPHHPSKWPTAKSFSWQDIFNAVSKQMEKEGYEANELFKEKIKDLTWDRGTNNKNVVFLRDALINYAHSKLTL